ncbi:type II toxin-antitoxin system PrlF family antitoxin [Paracoccus sp. MBLB3053]|uniref:Type II toxin-antitoxin system PrlF family antitoxin n=1 Tax=Paracoccus aurantius TaxID=3073814 RepID=A0ABU2HXT9_9RHOB|nr:type II toxin-antitoxin system PrlF family antitoxin [Paracoccus sp. MBLB3053]MDS9469868.1 type II toxin-antitoxin system PrlF family antitoxin [Paracoccus sp. MBLB3053]
MSESTISIKGQTTLPKAVRQALDLGPGDRLRYVILDDGQVRIMRRRPVVDLAGLLHRKGQGPVSLEDMDAAISEAARRG